MHIQFQTNELTPPPYAHAIEVRLKADNNELEVDFELTYLDREGLSKDEILEEGFSENDDIKWKGKLNRNWIDNFEDVAYGVRLKNKKELDNEEDFWQINLDGRTGYPRNTEGVLTFIQELQQAILETEEIEAPLNITIQRIARDKITTHVFKASFAEREFAEHNGGKKKTKPWDMLNDFLKTIFSGEFIPDQAHQKEPKKIGLFLSMGDGLWYELGKSYLIQPSKVQQYLD